MYPLPNRKLFLDMFLVEEPVNPTFNKLNTPTISEVVEYIPVKYNFSCIFHDLEFRAILHMVKQCVDKRTVLKERYYGMQKSNCNKQGLR